MWLIIAEALLALGLLVFIVWWTMFMVGTSRPGDSPQCNLRGIDSTNSAIGVSNAVPSSAMHW